MNGQRKGCYIKQRGNGYYKVVDNSATGQLDVIRCDDYGDPVAGEMTREAALVVAFIRAIKDRLDSGDPPAQVLEEVLDTVRMTGGSVEDWRRLTTTIIGGERRHHE
jgi:hypothetical protein